MIDVEIERRGFGAVGEGRKRSRLPFPEVFSAGGWRPRVCVAAEGRPNGSARECRSGSLCSEGVIRLALVIYSCNLRARQMHAITEF